eukprot:CAMPEP_0202897294 /NCGR_PEP_ID=MMETSP1392-20130828/6089_1 /ASSEMBLY_ACC=CAM_ASM_000868 /TAXON_ID=225041 /ORGANISM="Chlamydomonas chlamydogama, Strain SAG 11-48b" /LENGTH=290 /DNA_ID=CAMNT_0049582893 /DNA_START=66 /DNA_END=938 /DNA_ORIENTATION=-
MTPSNSTTPKGSASTNHLQANGTPQHHHPNHRYPHDHHFGHHDHSHDSIARVDGEEDDEHTHTSQRSPWLRAMMMGALDGLLSVASVMLGVGGGSGDLRAMRLAGLAAWIAGALSMFLGEYASVAAQRDAEKADIEKEREMQGTPETRAHELEELTLIYVNRGLCYDTARQVAEQLTEVDVIRAHARDELGIDMDDLSNPLQAGLVDMIAFTVGSAVPLAVGSFITDDFMRMVSVAAASVLACAAFGYIAAHLSGVRVAVGTVRVLLVGVITLAATYGVGVGFSKLGVQV